MNLVEKDLKYIWHPCSQMKDYEELKPIIIDRGKGIYLYDIHGKEYMDVVSSWWCNLLGHCHPVINSAVKSQLDKLEHVIFANFSHKPAIKVCEKLSEILPRAWQNLIFSDNGSAAVECALKMSFQYQQQSGHQENKVYVSHRRLPRGNHRGLVRWHTGFIRENVQPDPYRDDPGGCTGLLPLSTG